MACEKHQPPFQGKCDKLSHEKSDTWRKPYHLYNHNVSPKTKGGVFEASTSSPYK